ncbi:ribonuclease HII [Omnitrophica bacterium]|nr:ribonuclease HII [Candidatus Omnitrophota bacterium]
MAIRHLLRMLRHEKKARKKGFNLIAGIDEAGRGPLAGPVVAAAVIINDFDFFSEINDSKLLSPKKRHLASQEIIQKSTIGISLVDEDTIDNINIRQATILAMEEAVINLGVDPDILLIDGRLRLDLPYPQKHIIRGDSKSLSIAAASIIAKVTRDSLMLSYHRLYPRYRFDLHKGYGTRKHIRAIRKYGPSPIQRKTFRIHPFSHLRKQRV